MGTVVWVGGWSYNFEEFNFRPSPGSHTHTAKRVALMALSGREKYKNTRAFSITRAYFPGEMTLPEPSGIFLGRLLCQNLVGFLEVKAFLPLSYPLAFLS